MSDRHYTEEEVRRAFWETFHEAGEIWFGDRDPDDLFISDHWKAFASWLNIQIEPMPNCDHEWDEGETRAANGLPQGWCKRCRRLLYKDAEYRLTTREAATESWRKALAEKQT